MKKLSLIMTSILIVGIVLLSTNFIYAQQRDNNSRRQNQDRRQFDPQEMMKRRMEQIMERLKEHQNSAWRKYLDKKEAAMLDEIAIIKYESTPPG